MVWRGIGRIRALKIGIGKKGAFVSFPRGIPHTFTIESEKARFLVVNTPGGFEHMFELAPKTPEEAARAMTAYDMEIVGPHPRETAVLERRG